MSLSDYKPDSREIKIGGKVVNDVPPKDRDIAMVFQNYALYPHMTVYRNMAFALALRGAARTMPVHTSDVAYKGPELTALLGQASLVGPFLKNVLVNRLFTQEVIRKLEPVMQ